MTLQIIELTFDVLHLENPYGSQCVFDSVSLYDGIDESARLIGKLCGQSSNTITRYSSANYMHIVFRSDDSLQYAGFTAVYNSLDPNTVRKWTCVNLIICVLS